nr:MAG TPA: Ail/Lom protein [Bacteriophage sp.]
MKKIAVLLCIIFCIFATSAFADDYLYFGFNYSNTLANGNFSHGIGGNFSAIGDYGGAKKVYAAFGFTADISSKRAINNNDLKTIGVKDINARFYSIPLRIGYPFMFNVVNENNRFLLIPALAFDIHFLHADFSQRKDGYKINYDMSGWGFSIGTSLDIGMDHKFNKIYLRYGLDFDIRFLTLLLLDIKYTGDITGSTSTTSTDTIANSFMLTTSPYICIGFKL